MKQRIIVAVIGIPLLLVRGAGLGHGGTAGGAERGGYP